MSRKYKAHNPDSIYFVTFTIVDWVALLNRPLYKHIIVDALNYCTKEKSLNILGYVIMDNHVHALLFAERGNLPAIIRDFKQFTSKQLIKAIKSNSQESRKDWLLDKFLFVGKNSRNHFYKVWQDGYHGIEANSTIILEQKLEYIHQNPIRAEIVREAHDYCFSSAVDYAGGKGDVNVTLI